MAADTALKRYSAMHISMTWRGLNVVPDAAIPQGERQAVMFMYSGILAAAATPVVSGGDSQSMGMLRQMTTDPAMDTAMGQA
jgi:hypothetical protein